MGALPGRLDERALRRPGFRPGVEIPLGDGQRWHFREPVMRFYHRRDPGSGRFVATAGRLSLGPDFDVLLDEVIEAENGVVELTAALNLAALMLAPHYTLTDDQLLALLPCVPGDPGNVEMWQAIVEVALGHAPKRSSGGSDAPSSPTGSPATSPTPTPSTPAACS